MNLTIIQIGANRGYDDLTDILSQFPVSAIARLILIEPLSIHYDKLAACYSHIQNKIILNNAVTDIAHAGQVIDFWYHIADGPKYEVASTTKAHIMKHARSNPAFLDESGYRSIKSFAVSLNHLFEMLAIDFVDILFIDAEGHDSAIVKSLDLQRFHIGNIYFENLHLPEGSANPEAAVYRFLEAADFSVTLKTLTNGWMSHAAKRCTASKPPAQLHLGTSD